MKLPQTRETADDILYHVILNNTQVSLISTLVSLNSINTLASGCFWLAFILGLGFIAKRFGFWQLVVGGLVSMILAR